MTFDPRLTPDRPDLAAEHLEGQVKAARFVAGTVRAVVEPQAPVRRAPSPDAALDTEALMGERVTVYETTDEGWAWGQLQDDGYVGWLPAAALDAAGRAADAQGRGTAHAGVSRARHQAAAAHGPAVRRAPRGRPPRGAFCGDGSRRLRAGAAPRDDRCVRAPISSPWPSASSACPICGAARPAWVSTAPAWSRWR